MYDCVDMLHACKGVSQRSSGSSVTEVRRDVVSLCSPFYVCILRNRTLINNN